jgi:hypothetical protein
MISKNVEFLRYCGGHFDTCRRFQNGRHNTAKIQHCPISSKFDMWVDNDVAAILKTATGINCSMLEINSGHH